MKLFLCLRILNTHFRQKDSKQVSLCYIFVQKLKKFPTKEYKRAILASNGNAWYLKMPLLHTLSILLLYYSPRAR